MSGTITAKDITKAVRDTAQVALVDQLPQVQGNILEEVFDKLGDGVQCKQTVTIKVELDIDIETAMIATAYELKFARKDKAVSEIGIVLRLDDPENPPLIDDKNEPIDYSDTTGPAYGGELPTHCGICGDESGACDCADPDGNLDE